MEHPEKPDAGNSLSRRKALKRIGAGAAIAWSAPVITSLKTPAFAQTPPPECRQCAPFDCNNSAFCQSPCFSFCVQRINLACFCGPLVAWNTSGSPICQSDADCPAQTGPGSVCINMNPNCQAVDNKGCAAPCPGGKVLSRPGMRVRQA
jgi:hypothetical protein